MVERPEISLVLAQIRATQGQIHRTVADLGRDIAPGGRIDSSAFVRPIADQPGFSELFANAIDSVNSAQQHSSELRQAYELGTDGVSLTQVMLAAEKSSVAFQAMVQVRNRLVEAYKEIMNMPV